MQCVRVFPLGLVPTRSLPEPALLLAEDMEGQEQQEQQEQREQREQQKEGEEEQQAKAAGIIKAGVLVGNDSHQTPSQSPPLPASSSSVGAVDTGVAGVVGADVVDASCERAAAFAALVIGNTWLPEDRPITRTRHTYTKKAHVHTRACVHCTVLCCAVPCCVVLCCVVLASTHPPVLCCAVVVM